MSRSGRKAVIRVIEGLAVALVVLDLGVYLALVRPLGRMRAREETLFSATRTRVREANARVARLEQFQSAVPESEGQLNSFLKSHVPSRRQGFSRAARLVRRLTEQSGLGLSSISYKLDSSRDDPLVRLGLEIDVEGPFPSLMNFAHALETTSEFVVVRGFAFDPVEGGAVALRLDADLYLKP